MSVHPSCLSLCSSVLCVNLYVCVSVRPSVCLLFISSLVHLYVCWSVRPSVCLLFVSYPVHLYVCWSVRPSVCLLFISYPVHLYVCWSVRPSVCLSIHLLYCPSVCLLICMSLCLSLHSSAFLSICLSVILSIHLYASLSAVPSLHPHNCHLFISLYNMSLVSISLFLSLFVFLPGFSLSHSLPLTQISMNVLHEVYLPSFLYSYFPRPISLSLSHSVCLFVCLSIYLRFSSMPTQKLDALATPLASFVFLWLHPNLTWEL
jgi:hypothetical protein